jgi:lipopolysaccharide/colanic/teichoic acid biosynthesis glycosyltransferase
MQSAKIAYAKSSLWNRIRFQYGVGLLLATFLPYWARLSIEQAPTHESLSYSLVGTIVALTLGYFSFRQTSFYPGVRASYGVLPSYAISYGLVLSFFFFARIDYSRLQFLASVLICIAWYFLVYFKLRRDRPVLGVLPFGNVSALFQIPGPEWMKIENRLVADNTHFDGIVADLRHDIPDEWERFLADQALAGTLVLHVKQVEESLTGRVEIEHLSENTFGSLIPGIVYEKAKRLVDFTVATVLALPLAMFLLPIALWIKLDSKGPVLFTQERVGYRGDTFTVFKLRTMHVNADPARDPRSAAITLDSDRRVTRAGRLLKGDMSWIGPRPEAVALSDWYESELPFYRYRHIVRPGITGWAQVNQGHVAEVADVLWKLHYDFYYIRNFSFWLDVLIVAKTMRTVLTGFGSR